MAEKLVNAIIGAFSGLTSMAFGKELLVFVISLLPILELRGGLIAAALLKFSYKLYNFNYRKYNSGSIYSIINN